MKIVAAILIYLAINTALIIVIDYLAQRKGGTEWWKDFSLMEKIVSVLLCLPLLIFVLAKETIR